MSAKIYLASVLTSILILAPVTYFVLPILYPNMTMYIDDDDVNGVVLQSEYFVFDSEARILDNELSFKMMNGTTCLIQTQGNSSLTILFSTVAVMSLNSAWTEKSEYIIDLVIEGVGSKAILHAFHDDGPVHGAYRVITYDITINLDTGILIAGTYNISVFWRSTVDAVGTNSFYIYDPGNDYLRSLWIQEIYHV